MPCNNTVFNNSVSLKMMLMDQNTVIGQFGFGC